MKKIVIISILSLFTLTSNAGIYRSEINSERNTDRGGSLYENSINSANGEGSSGALYRGSITGPGGRPNPWEGIGQETPVGDGLHLLILFGAAFGCIKFFASKREKMLRTNEDIP